VLVWKRKNRATLAQYSLLPTVTVNRGSHIHLSHQQSVQVVLVYSTVNTENSMGESKVQMNTSKEKKKRKERRKERKEKKIEIIKSEYP
jgi:hypothetical protein